MFADDDPIPMRGPGPGKAPQVTANQPPRTSPIVYLDQWVWIRLARAAHGHADAADAVDALAKLRELVAADLIVCPLSNVRYMGTQAHYVEARRIRLGVVMVELGRLRTLVGARAPSLGGIQMPPRCQFALGSAVRASSSNSWSLNDCCGDHSIWCSPGGQICTNDGDMVVTWASAGGRVWPRMWNATVPMRSPTQ